MIFKEKLQKDIGYCESQNACCVNKCMIKDFQIFEWGISNNHQGLT